MDRRNPNGDHSEGQKESLVPRAFESIVYYLAQRDHSEKELKTKLRRRYDTETIAAALERARERGYLRDPAELSIKATAALLRRKKSAGYIRQFLRQKGLPVSTIDETEEAQNARAYLTRRFGSLDDMAFEQKKKAAAALRSRGFSTNVIRTVLYEK